MEGTHTVPKTPDMSFIEAARKGESGAIARLLCKHAASLRADHWGQAVAWATYNRHHHCLLLLLSHAQALEVINSPFGGGGNTPLHLAVMNNDSVALRHLARFGVCPSFDVPNASGVTPRQLALQGASPEIRQLLADIEAHDPRERPDALRRDRSTLLIQAARSGDDAHVSLLLSMGADPTFRDTQGGSALLWAVYNQRNTAATILLSHRASHEASVRPRTQDSVLHLSALHNDVDMTRLLLQFDAFDPLALNSEAKAPRDMATDKAVRLLLTPFAHAHALNPLAPLPQAEARCSQCSNVSRSGCGSVCQTMGCSYLICSDCNELHDMWQTWSRNPRHHHSTHSANGAGDLCVMCRKDRVQVTNLPCGHTFLCTGCSDTFRTKHGAICISCRQPSTVQAAVTRQTCAVCMEEVELAQLCCLAGCGHMMCNGCSASFVRGALSDIAASFPLRCPGYDLDGSRCLVLVDTTRLAHLRSMVDRPSAGDQPSLLSEEDIERACRCQDTAALPRNQQIHCPLCNDLLLLDSPIDECRPAAGFARFDCPSCRRAFCFNCRVPWHQDMTCAAFQADPQQLDQTRAFIGRTSKECPFCRTPVTHYRDHGCHHIVPGRGCPGCGRHFCYVCLQEWPCPSGCGLFCNARCGCMNCPECLPGQPCPQCDGNCPSCD